MKVEKGKEKLEAFRFNEASSRDEIDRLIEILSVEFRDIPDDRVPDTGMPPLRSHSF